MPKHVLKSLDLTTLLVALDHVEEHGPPTALPDPETSPGECVYLAYIGEAHAAALAARLPHADVLFRTPGAGARSKVVRKVYNKAAILHILRFCFPNGDEFQPFVRELSRVDRKYWRVLQPGEDPANLKRRKPRK